MIAALLGVIWYFLVAMQLSLFFRPASPGEDLAPPLRLLGICFLPLALLIISVRMIPDVRKYANFWERLVWLLFILFPPLGALSFILFCVALSFFR